MAQRTARILRDRLSLEDSDIDTWRRSVRTSDALPRRSEDTWEDGQEGTEVWQDAGEVPAFDHDEDGLSAISFGVFEEDWATHCDGVGEADDEGLVSEARGRSRWSKLESGVILDRSWEVDAWSDWSNRSIRGSEGPEPQSP